MSPLGRYTRSAREFRQWENRGMATKSYLLAALFDGANDKYLFAEVMDSFVTNDAWLLCF